MDHSDAIKLTKNLPTIDLGGDPECRRCRGTGLDETGETLCRCCDHDDYVVACSCTGMTDVFDLRDYDPEQVERFSPAIAALGDAYVAHEGEKGQERLVLKGEVSPELERTFKRWVREQAALFARTVEG